MSPLLHLYMQRISRERRLSAEHWISWGEYYQLKSTSSHEYLIVRLMSAGPGTDVAAVEMAISITGVALEVSENSKACFCLNKLYLPLKVKELVRK